MGAGGQWRSQNKTRPGAYINFKAVDRAPTPAGERGIGTIPLPLSWGARGELIDIYSTDLIDGASMEKIGFTAFDAESKMLAGMLSYCNKKQRSMVAEPLCLNSKSGRNGTDGLQPSLSSRIYSPDGKHTALTTCHHPKIAELADGFHPVRVGSINK
ncbi:MAG: hypothetical protein LBC86_11120 [Oscillospiraceae bacterium]|jgi:hypothetical protein|nr:hypothetical protein [Oscillospiraceae bacterium]